MKNQWPIWFFVLVVVAVVIIAFNFQGNNSGDLSEVYTGDDIENMPAIEYEFVDESSDQAATPSEKQEPALVKNEVSEVLPLNEKSSQHLTTPFTQVPFTIQVSSYKERKRAEMALQGMKAAGYPAYISEKNLGSKGTWYRIYVGKFDTKVQADEYLSKVKEEYKDCFIISPK